MKDDAAISSNIKLSIAILPTALYGLTISLLGRILHFNIVKLFRRRLSDPYLMNLSQTSCAFSLLKEANRVRYSQVKLAVKGVLSKKNFSATSSPTGERGGDARRLY